MDEAKRAQQVWRNAQKVLVEASARRLHDLSEEEMKLAERNYQRALVAVDEAKKYYDNVRIPLMAEQLRLTPKAC